MLNSILQTLAEILAGGTSLTSTEQINFSHPAALRDQSTGPRLNLYVYDLRANKQRQHSGKQIERRPVSDGRALADVSWSPDWFDVSMVLMAQDRTVLREHHLLTEALTLLLRHRSLREEFLAPALRGYGNLSMTVSTDTPFDVSSVWHALSVSIQPAIFLTVTVPLQPEKTATPIVLERLLTVQNLWPEASDRTTASLRVAAAGVVKNALTIQPLAGVEVVLRGTKKAVMSNPKGGFFFENLDAGNYVLQLSLSGFKTQNCNVLVDRSTSTFKEVLLLPVQHQELHNAGIKCTQCESTQTSKNGHRRGKQIYLCKQCGRQFVDPYSPKGHSDLTVDSSQSLATR